MKKKLTVLVLAFAMVLTMSASVFAAGNGSNSGHNSGADSYLPGEANIVSYVIAPEGLTVPATEFTYTFAPVAGRNVAYAQTGSVKTVKINTTDMTSAGVEGNLVKTKAISEIFSASDFAGAGEYTYNVTQSPASANNDDNWTYAEETYVLRLIVNRDKEITDVTVEKGGNPSDADNDKKVEADDVTPSDNTKPNDSSATPSPSDSLGGFTFTNNYTEDVENHNEPKDPNPSDGSMPGDPTSSEPGAFVLDKFVLGEYGDETKDFEFNVTVTLPMAKKNFDFAANAPTVTTQKGSIDGTWADGATVKVYLKHDGQLNFPKLPVGTKITVEEINVPNGYTKAYVSSNDDDSPADVLVTKADGGYVICRNSFDDTSITPTGIIINNLPYVLLIAIAFAGIVLFSRKRRYE